MTAISIIIPTYNESENIERLICGIHQELRSDYEIVVVDDNSPDGTADVVRRLSKELSVRLIVRKKKGGLASAIVDGAKHARGSRILVMDADLSHPPKTIPKLLKHTEDIVVASRHVRGGRIRGWPALRKVESKAATFLARNILGIAVKDPMSGFFLIRRDIILNTPATVRGFKILLDILIKNPRAYVREVPYTFSDRLAGNSKMNSGEILNFCSAIVHLLSYKILFQRLKSRPSAANPQYPLPS